MIDAGPSLRAAEGLSGSSVAAYLLTKGWSARPSRVEGITILSKRIAGLDQPAEIILPVTSGFDEEQRRIADAIRVVAQMEGASVSRVADEIRDSVESTKPADNASVPPASKIATEVVENISAPDLDPVRVLEISLRDFRELGSRSGHGFDVFISHTHNYEHRIREIEQFASYDDFSAIRMDQIVQHISELFGLQFQEAINESLIDLSAVQQRRFLQYLKTANALTSRIQKESYVTQLAVIIALFDPSSRSANTRWFARFWYDVETRKAAVDPARRLDKTLEALIVRYARFVHDALRLFKAALISHDVI